MNYKKLKLLNEYRYILLIFTIAVSLSSSAFGQKLMDDFDLTKRVNYRSESSTNRQHRDEDITADEVIIPVQIHVISNTLGSHRDTAGILQDFQDIQPWFSQTGFKFEFCNSVHFIQSDEWYELDTDQESQDMVNSANNPNTMDVFYVKNINHIAACGYASLGWNTDGYIVIQDGCNEATLAHEIGHYFNLPHTHDNSIPELVDGTNCDAAGDYFCDTPADPDLTGNVNSSCVYTGTNLDSNGDTYSPSTSNIMSYSLKQCYSTFSAEQSAAMVYYYENTAKNNLVCGTSVNLSVISIGTFADTISRDVPYEYSFDLSNISSFTYSGDVEYAVSYSTSSSGSKLPLSSGTIQGSWGIYSSTREQINFSLPNDLADGYYYFFLEIDPSKKIGENSYTDNETQFWSVYVTGNVPLTVDIAASATLANEPYAGYPVTVNFDYTNVGQLDDAKSSVIVDFYISEDSIPSSDDVVTAMVASFSNLSVGIKNSRTWSMPLIKDQPLQYIIMVIRKNKGTNEVNLDNNKIVLPVTPNTGNPGSPNADVELVEVSLYNPTIKVFQSIGAKYKLRNGAVVDEDIYTQVRDVTMGFYVSTDSILSPDDLHLGYEMAQSVPLAQNVNVNHGTYSIKMLSIAPGDYYLIAKADDLDMLNEVDEENNIAFTNITVTPGTDADLVIANMSTPDVSTMAGNEVTLNVTVKNLGYTTAENYTVNTFLSTAKVYTTNDPLFSNSSMDSLAAGDSVIYQVKANIPSDLAPGIYYHTAIIHSNGNEFTGNNSNFPTLEFEVVSTNVGLKENISPWIKVYPNPTRGTLWIVSEIENEIEVSIRSALGEVLAWQVVKGRSSIILPRARGIYFVSLKSGEQEKITRVIKY